MVISRKVLAYMSKPGIVILKDGGLIKGDLATMISGVCDNSIITQEVPFFTQPTDTFLSGVSDEPEGSSGAAACTVNGALVILRNQGGGYQYYCFAFDHDTQEAYIVTLSGYNDSRLPAIFQHKLWNLEKEAVQVPQTQKLHYKDVIMPSSQIPPEGVSGGVQKLGFICGEPYYENYSFSFTFNRRLTIEKRPRIKYEVENSPGSGQYSQLARVAAISVYSQNPAGPGMFLGAQDTLLGNSVPACLYIGSSGEIMMISGKVGTEIVRTAELITMWGPSYPPEDHVIFHELLFKEFNQDGFLDKETDLHDLMQGQHAAGDYPYNLGDSGDWFGDILRTPVRISYESLTNVWTIKVRKHVSHENWEKSTYEEDYLYSNPGGVSGPSNEITLRADSANNPHKVNVIEHENNLFSFPIQLRQNVNRSQAAPVSVGGGRYTLTKDTEAHTLEVYMGTTQRESLSNSVTGWISDNSVQAPIGDGQGILRIDPLNVLMYGQYQESGYDVFVYSEDRIIYQYNDYFYADDESPWVWNPVNPGDPNDLVQYDAFFVLNTHMLVKNEVKWFLNINGQRQVISLPTQIREAFTGEESDENGNPLLKGLKLRLLQEHNKARADHGIECAFYLIPDAFLERVAQYKVDDMVNTGHFAHTGVNGDTILDRPIILGTPLDSITENLAKIYKGNDTPLTEGDMVYVVEQWMGSPGHRAALLNPYSDYVGFSFAYRPEDGYWYFSTEFAYYQDDVTHDMVAEGVALNAVTGDWYTTANFTTCANVASGKGEDGRGGYAFPIAMGIIYEQDNWTTWEYSDTPGGMPGARNQMWGPIKSEAVYTNEVSPVDSEGDSVDPYTLPGYEMRDLSLSVYGDLLMLSFLISSVWVEQSEFMPLSGHRNKEVSWQVAEELDQRVFQFYNLKHPTAPPIWNGKITGDQQRLTAGIIDLVGGITSNV